MSQEQFDYIMYQAMMVTGMGQAPGGPSSGYGGPSHYVQAPPNNHGGQQIGVQGYMTDRQSQMQDSFQQPPPPVAPSLVPDAYHSSQRTFVGPSQQAIAHVHSQIPSGAMHRQHSGYNPQQHMHTPNPPEAVHAQRPQPPVGYNPQQNQYVGRVLSTHAV
ncbi:hypothetical protein NMY22_g4398 [Coprinellus aureogranulatus]|nr:hypothetical protein NMY22_g4398 [Coprinellus aureogranulatus]